MFLTDLLEFLKQHYKLIIYSCLLLFSIILLIVRKRPNKIIDTIAEKLYSLLPLFIRYAEDKFGSGYGSDKKSYVLDLVKEWFSAEGLEFTDYYFKLASMFIEEILNTPEKK